MTQPFERLWTNCTSGGRNIDPADRCIHYFVSTFSWLQWPAVRELAREREMVLRPILFGALLKQMDQRGPVEISRKREFSYRYALWRARQANVPLKFPPAHPFNPLPALRLCMAAGSTPEAVGAIFEWIWAHGRAADTP